MPEILKYSNIIFEKVHPDIVNILTAELLYCPVMFWQSVLAEIYFDAPFIFSQCIRLHDYFNYNFLALLR